jgi:hypothetical protein
MGAAGATFHVLTHVGAIKSDRVSETCFENKPWTRFTKIHTYS